MKLQDRTVMITGASRGLGRALAVGAAREGARVVLVARDRAPLDEVVREIRHAGGTAFGVAADIGDKHAIHGLAAQAARLVGNVEILIHNASELGPVPLRELMDTDCETL